LLEKLENYLKSREVVIGLFIILLVAVFIPLKVVSYGWTPPDDGLRHVAFSTVDIEWSDVLLIKPELASDHNPGWHWILKSFYRLGLDKEGLMMLSVVGLFALVHIAGLLVVSKPIAWFLSFFILVIVEPGVLFRFFLGRPFIFTFAITFFLLKLWTDNKFIELQKNKLSPLWRGIISVILVALSTWIHGSWYLFFLVVFAFILAGRFREAGQLSLCVILGTFVGALLSGDFMGFMYFQKNATLAIFTEDVYNWQLVTEFGSGRISMGWFWVIVCLAAYMIKTKKRDLEEILLDPVLILTLLGWCLGIKTYRFWGDWGVMAFMYWTAKAFSDSLPLEIFNNLRIRYSLFIFLTVSVFFLATHDGGGRYSRRSLDQPIDFTSEELCDWAPGEDGIVYSYNMSVFYNHFYAYPKAKWKYVLGFESAIMPDEDRLVLRQIGMNDGRVAGDYMPWINKMRPQDRLILPAKLADTPMLEWKIGARYHWIGRKLASETLNLNK
jgi:hypothetical protein